MNQNGNATLDSTWIQCCLYFTDGDGTHEHTVSSTSRDGIVAPNPDAVKSEPESKIPVADCELQQAVTSGSGIFEHTGYSPYVSISPMADPGLISPEEKPYIVDRLETGTLCCVQSPDSFMPGSTPENAVIAPFCVNYMTSHRSRSSAEPREKLKPFMAITAGHSMPGQSGKYYVRVLRLFTRKSVSDRDWVKICMKHGVRSTGFYPEVDC